MALRPPHAVLAMLAVAIHIVGGCLLLAMAVLGEYVGRIYQECKGRPLYVLSEGHSIEIPAVRPDANAA
jgi:dolichol-phosphate mannosyltransferase